MWCVLNLTESTLWCVLNVTESTLSSVDPHNVKVGERDRGEEQKGVQHVGKFPAEYRATMERFANRNKYLTLCEFISLL